MRSIAKAACLAAFSFAAAIGAARADDCPACVIGIWDDPALTATRGTIFPGIPKEVYVGVRLTNGDTDLAGLEFSVHGVDMDGLHLLGATALGPRALVWGNLGAPPDSSEGSDGVGGGTVAWGQPVAGDVALVRLLLYADTDVSNRMLVVKRAYPPVNPNFRTPLVIRDDAPNFTKVRVSGGCYLLNPSNQAHTDCESASHPTAVEAATWGAVKTLFQ